MVRTQIQLPDEIYRKAKRIAAQHEISLAEVVRRGLEHMIRVHPTSTGPEETWTLPPPRHLGAFLSSPADFRELANEPAIPGKRRR
jgi:hypothetical protein